MSKTILFSFFIFYGFNIASAKATLNVNNDTSAKYELQFAIKSGDVVGTKAALDKLTDINSVILDEEFTLLQYACLKFDVSEASAVQILKLVLSRYSDFNEVGFGDWQGTHHFYADWSPLMIAYAFQSPNFISELEKAGAKIDVNSGLFASAHNIYPDFVEKFLKLGANINNRIVKYGYEEQTALMFASEENIDLLLSAGADPNALDKEQNSTLIIYASNMYKVYGQYRSPNSLVKIAKAGGRLDQQNIYGDTALMKSIENNQTAFVETLLSLGASTELKNNKNKTAFGISADKTPFWPRPHEWNKVKQIEIAKILVKYHADASLALLQHTFYEPDADYTEILLSSNISNKIKNQALMRAVKNYGLPDVVKSLVIHGADVNYRDSDLSVLDLAAKEDNYRNLAILKLTILREAGAHLDAQSPGDGHTAVMFAASFGNYDSVEYLINAGVNLNLKDNNGKTAFDRAANSYVQRLIRNAGGISGN